jgi:hypothetical protein
MHFIMELLVSLGMYAKKLYDKILLSKHLFSLFFLNFWKAFSIKQFNQNSNITF